MRLGQHAVISINLSKKNKTKAGKILASEKISSPLISIIVPCFNTSERLLIRCVDSIINQTMKDFELIIVNDGSSWEYTAIFEKIVKKDSRICVLAKDNEGVSLARNYGTQRANGKYIVYIDADDFVSSDYLEQAYGLMAETGSDFVIGSIKTFSDGDDTERNLYKELHTVEIYKVYDEATKKELAPRLISDIIYFEDGSHINRGPVARLLKKEIADHALFVKGIKIGEDIIWNQRVIKLCKKICVADAVWYYYCNNVESAVNKYKEDAIACVKDQMLSLVHEVDMNDNQMYFAYFERMFSETRQHICRAYLTRKENDDSFIKKYRTFNMLAQQEPWSWVSSRYFDLANIKGKMQYILFKSRLYFPVCYIKDRFK